jgi:hypothetical protein
METERHARTRVIAAPFDQIKPTPPLYLWISFGEEDSLSVFIVAFGKTPHARTEKTWKKRAFEILTPSIYYIVRTSSSRSALSVPSSKQRFIPPTHQPILCVNLSRRRPQMFRSNLLVLVQAFRLHDIPRLFHHFTHKHFRNPR